MASNGLSNSSGTYPFPNVLHPMTEPASVEPGAPAKTQPPEAKATEVPISSPPPNMGLEVVKRSERSQPVPVCDHISMYPPGVATPSGGSSTSSPRGA